MKAPLLFALISSLLACSAPSSTPVVTPAADAAVVPPAPTGGAGEATLFLMADLNGVLRPCGCTVELQKGGFDRLIPYLAAERERHPEAELIHAGPIFYESASVEANKKAQRERQVEVAADLIAKTGISVAGATAVDEVASGGGLSELGTRAKVQLTAANLKLKGGDVSGHVVKEIGGLRVGMFALAAAVDEASGAAGVEVSDPEAAARSALAALAGKSDVVVLLSALGLRETKRLVRKVEGIDFAIAGGLGEHPTASDEAELVGATRVMQFHREGRYFGRLTIRKVPGAPDELVDASAVSEGELAILDDRIARLDKALAKAKATKPATDDEVKSLDHHLASLKTSRERLSEKKVVVPSDRSSFSFTQTALNWDLPQDPSIVELMKAFDDELAKINIAHAGTLPEPKPGEAVYVGTEACFECHEDTQAFWKANEHAGAWATLEKLGKTFDAECVSCHVTGYGKAGGSLLGKTAGRENVQCESCHGPGSLHSVEGDLATIVAKPTEDTCTGCHNHHHSPSFKFGSYREHLLVPGHGKPLK